jgi:peptidoglycan/xylan/chitin deacetylase (PgdA/CDA1 family)
MSRIVSIAVTLDGIEEYGARQGLPADALHVPKDETEPVYGKGWPRLLALMARCGLSATFFPLGRYLATPVPTALAREALATGHELGNHTYAAHELSGRSPDDLAREIEQGEAALENATGTRPVGFCAPAHHASQALSDALSARKYLYDASLLPSPPAAAAANMVGSALRRVGLSLPRLPGNLGSVVAPREPFRVAPGSYLRPGAGPLVALPVSALPLARVPLVSSLLLQTSAENAKTLLSPLRGAPFVQVLLSGLDLLGRDEIPESFLASRRELQRPLQERDQLLEELLSWLVEGAENLTLADAARRFSANA